LVFTGITRNSTEVLKSVVVPQDDTFNPLVVEAESMILNGKLEKFIKLIKNGWEEKKRTSKDLLNNMSVKDLDQYLEMYPGCVAHKLCGAGNGGFFLCFFETKKPPNNHKFVKVELNNNGIERII
jgi:galactokinase/mevalonate kinase-like predicted kinase